MGLIYQTNVGLIRAYGEETIPVRKALLQTGQSEVKQKVAKLDPDEVEIILLKLDQLAMSRQHEGIAVMLAEEAENILTAIRMVKDQTKEAFQGMLGLGSALDMCWLRARHVGDTTLLNDSSTTGLGLYSGTNGAVYTWLQSFIAGTTKDIIPTQTMIEEAAVIHLGAIDTVEIPKCNAITFTLQGVDSPTQSMKFSIRKATSSEDLPFVRFEKPVIVGPEKKQKVTVVPNITGDSKLELLSLLITKASLLVA